jgi:CheY-like chemotaxis protein
VPNRDPVLEPMNTVLIVEDSHSQRECISYQLAWNGMNVIQACDGIDALNKLQATCPDLVLLDVVMPRIDGYRLCRLIKANPKTQNIPVVFITGKEQQLAIYEGIKHAEAYVSKPWKSRELLQTIKRVLLEAKGSTTTFSADAWFRYGILTLKLIKFYENRTYAWQKSGDQIIKLYKTALNAFQQSLEINPDHLLASRTLKITQNKWENFQQQLDQTRPCQVCLYYHGQDGINCAVHPNGPIDLFCLDWEINEIIIDN